MLKLISVSIGHFFNDFYMNLIPPILFIFQQEMSLSLTQQGVIAFIITSSGAFAQPLVGHLIDRKGKPWLVIISVSWIAVFMSISGLISNYYLLLFVVGVGALASAVFHPLGSAIAIKLSKQTRSRNLSIFMTVGRFAAFASPVVALPLVKNLGLGSLAYLVIPGLFVAALIYWTGVQHVDLLHRNNNQKQLNQVAKLDAETIKWLTILVFIASSRMLIIRSLLTYGVQYLSLKNIDITTGGVVITLYLLFNSFGVISGGLLSDKIGELQTFILFNSLAAVSALVMVYASGYFLIIMFIMTGFSLSGSTSTNVVLAHDLIPRKINTATGLIMGLSGGFGGLGILLFGKLADYYGLLTTMSLILIPLVLIVFLSYIFSRRISVKAST